MRPGHVEMARCCRCMNRGERLDWTYGLARQVTVEEAEWLFWRVECGDVSRNARWSSRCCAVLWCGVLGGERVWWRTAVLLPERKVRTVDGVGGGVSGGGGDGEGAVEERRARQGQEGVRW